MDEVASLLQRMRELTVQAANDPFTSTDRAFMDQEYQGLKIELDRIATSTQYNGMPLLSGALNSFGSVGGPSVLHIGVNNAIGIDTLQVSIGAVTAGALGLITSNLLVQPDIALALSEVDSAIFSVNETRSSLGALMNRLESAITSLSIQETNTQAAESVIRDADFAKLSTEMVRFQILSQSSTAMLGQANGLPQSVLSLFDK
jgi:flagellin